MKRISDWYQRFLIYLTDSWYFIRFVARHFIGDDCTYRASALAFTTLLAIVPLMTVGLAILSSLPVFQGLGNPVKTFIFSNFVPATGVIVESYISQFTAQVSRLSLWGVLFLITTALLMMVTIEHTMNHIWRARKARHGIAALLLYWTILTLAPVFLGISLTASTYFFSLPFIREHHTPTLLLSGLPFLFSFLGFTFLYVVVPNCPVKIRHGLAGGLVASVLFESAKYAFAYYLGRYHTYELLYGAFATIPIFFVWVYWVWIITLLGAEIGYAYSVVHQRRRGESLSPFLQALWWLQAFWKKQQIEGSGITLENLLESSNYAYSIDIKDMLLVFEQTHLIHLGTDGLYHLSQDLDEVSLYALQQLLPYSLPRQSDLDVCPKHWQMLFSASDQALQQTLHSSLVALFRDDTRYIIG